MSAIAGDTIVAPATPVGRSALAMIRLDGPQSAEILRALSGSGDPEERVASVRTLRAIDAVIDECVAVRYVAPRSFTGNDLVEMTLHGNPLLVERLLAACVALGARIAEPGEFTERAVLNGKLDLVQAESIGDLIAARTELQARLSIGNLHGSLSRQAGSIRESLLFMISRLEAALDFSEEGYEFISREEALRRIATVLEQAGALAETYLRGRATTRGLEAVILGRPNAGKSTLLNLLVGSDRAIVTPVPGTTRDIVRETIAIGGLPVTLADTAGLRESDDLVEGIGIDRARAAAGAAELVLYLVDATVGLTEADRAEMETHTDRILIIYTKIDLASPPPGVLAISATSGQGMTELLAQLDAIVRDRFSVPENAPTVVNERQRGAVVDCLAAVEEARRSLEAGFEEQMVLVDLYRASNALGRLTGAITTEEVFTEIFSKFCIGK